MIRNNTAAYIHYSAYDTANSTGKTGDAGNHTLKVIVDGVVTDPINTPEEIGVGEYRLLLDEVETNLIKFICVAGVSSTSDVYIIPATVMTDLLISGAAFVGCYTAWDTAANAPKTGDVANHTITIAQDATSAGATNTPAEVDAVNVPGLYKIVATAAEATGKAVSIIGISATANVNIIPTELAPFTVDYPAAANVRLGTDYAETTLTGTLDLPGVSDVRDGTVFDNATQAGTAAIPGANDVREAIPTDDTVGNYVPADEDKHLLGDSYGSLGTEFTGTKALTSFQTPTEVILEDDEIIIFEGCD